jgi:hypothetical protein
MKRSILVLGAFLLLFGFTTVSFAQYNVNHRERRQQQRIYKGVRNGNLTWREARRLETRERGTNRMEWRMRRSGGGLNWRERRKLGRRLNGNSRAIYNQKHDRQHRSRY